MSARTRVVWVTLIAACTGVAGLLTLVGGNGESAGTGRSLTTVPLLRAAAPRSVEAVFDTRAPMGEGAWSWIVIHHSGTAAETASSLDEAHRGANLAGLGYHFVIGNGRRMGDGELHIGYRWLDQLPGAHVAGPRSRSMNVSSIGVCLVGDGDHRGFTAAQHERLAELLTALCGRLGIPRERVILHRDVAETTSPGRRFTREDLARALSAVR